MLYPLSYGGSGPREVISGALSHRNQLVTSHRAVSCGAVAWPALEWACVYQTRW